MVSGILRILPYRPTRHAAQLSVFVVLMLVAGSFFAQAAVADPGNGNANANANGVALEHRASGTAGTSGSPASPQPPSNADESGNGANNGPGPYTSTRDG